MFKIRPITYSDIPFLWEMLYQSIYVSAGEAPPSKDIINEPDLAKYVEGWGREGDIGFIALNSDNESIGSVTLRFFDESNKGYGFIDNKTPELGMAILKEYRGRGIGTELIKAIIQEAKAKGIASISLSVDPNNLAMRLYRRFGFTEVGTAGTSVTMKLNL